LPRREILRGRIYRGSASVPPWLVAWRTEAAFVKGFLAVAQARPWPEARGTRAASVSGSRWVSKPRRRAALVLVPTVVSAECCYGAELYDPSVAKGQMGICNTYLAGGAYGFFGSSTTAYGPSSGNGSADLVCQYFLQRVLAGSSLGRATLEARQRFVQVMSVLDPADMKTLAQFNLMGDPAIHPVAIDDPALVRTKVYRAVIGDASRSGRRLRREGLVRRGMTLGVTSGAAKFVRNARPRLKVRRALEAAARETGLGDLVFASYAVLNPAPRLFGKRSALRPSPSSFHVAVGRSRDDTPTGVRTVLIIATEVDGEIVQLRRLHSR